MTTNQPLEISRSVPVKDGDPQKIQDANLWIQTEKGFVNAAADPATFDAAVTEYVDLMDRTTWPLAQRSYILAHGGVPTVFIEPEDLPPDLAAQREAILKATEE